MAIAINKEAAGACQLWISGMKILEIVCIKRWQL
jgi:hypothetical protein